MQREGRELRGEWKTTIRLVVHSTVHVIGDCVGAASLLFHYMISRAIVLFHACGQLV